MNHGIYDFETYQPESSKFFRPSLRLFPSSISLPFSEILSYIHIASQKKEAHGPNSPKDHFHFLDSYIKSFFPAAAQGFIKGDEVGGDVALALDQGVFGDVKATLGIEHV